MCSLHIHDKEEARKRISRIRYSQIRHSILYCLSGALDPSLFPKCDFSNAVRYAACPNSTIYVYQEGVKKETERDAVGEG